MFKWRGQRLEKGKQRTRQLWEGEFDVVKEGLDEKQVIAFVDNLIAQHNASQQASATSLSLLIKKAVTEAEQIASSIKMRAQTEAEDEAATIISKAKQEAEEIKSRAEIETRKEATVPELVEEKVEAPVQFEKEATIPEPVEKAPEEPLGQYLPEERLGKEEKLGTKEAEPSPIKLDSQVLYTGEVELYIPIPVELKMVSRLYGYLQTIPELKVLHTRGSWDRGTTITVVLDKAMPLIGLLLKIPDVEVTPEMPQKDSLVGGRSGSLLRPGGRGARGIQLILKEAQQH